MQIPNEVVRACAAAGVRFYTGVPDSLLASLCEEFSRHPSHVTACNEGAAVALAIGAHLATGSVPVVYLQNSGLGNAINPLASLAAPEVFGIPMLLFIGWRGEIGPDGEQAVDEPQHRRQGAMTTGILELLGIPYQVVDKTTENLPACVGRAIAESRQTRRPAAILVRKGTFPAPAQAPADEELPTREAFLRVIARSLDAIDVVVATTGMTGRELEDIRRRETPQLNGRDLLVVGGMGHASHIALGIHLQSPGRRVVCLDGDGALLMHMGALPYLASASGVRHIVLNNGVHDSVGGHKTIARSISLTALARAAGYGRVVSTSQPDQIPDILSDRERVSLFLEIMCRPGHRPDVPRPLLSPVQNKQVVMCHLEVEEE
jgi:phosphonopyruvate decarboxylase